MEIHANDQILFDKEQIKEVFVDAMKNVLGVSNRVLEFDASVLYPENPSLDHLQNQFTNQEIHTAVKQLANNKSSGPDGLPNEFLKIYWEELKESIFAIMQQFYE